MPSNPTRLSQGGDVSGETAIDITMGAPLKVATASFEPGYDTALSRPDTSKADLQRGYCDYGRSIGEPGSPHEPMHDGRKRQVDGSVKGSEHGAELKGSR